MPPAGARGLLAAVRLAFPGHSHPAVSKVGKAHCEHCHAVNHVGVIFRHASYLHSETESRLPAEFCPLYGCYAHDDDLIEDEGFGIEFRRCA